VKDLAAQSVKEAAVAAVRRAASEDPSVAMRLLPQDDTAAPDSPPQWRLDAI
jgi:hypothetical protein